MAESQRKPLPFIANFAAGAIAGVSEILTFYPLGQNAHATFYGQVERRFTRKFSNNHKGRRCWSFVSSIQYLHIPHSLRLSSHYEGLVPPLLLEAPKRAVKFAANDFWGRTFLQMTGEKKMNQQLSILTGCSAGATESFVVVPFELVKIRLQDKSSTYAGPMDVVKQIVKKEGLLGLHLWWNGGYFGCIFQVKSMMPKAETPQAQLFNNFISGSIGGLAGTVVKSRIQGTIKVPGVKPKYNWTYPALVTIFREEGPAALYKGFVPKVLRLAPGGGVLLLVVEFTLGVFRKALGPPYI
ncbi:putative odc2-mitochondrial 2-oxodicarboxylate carrier [Moniliophthora roreri]|nr:putative odc2-mitochondrial 2-oxodicarboxylate carrier [Moniliophthora roreri]